ncbi:MAG: DNA topoisomerase I [Candidatus Micrarchaeota archaeon]|nr:DNA topoisomerase I [Candidatus Micrarchaeota archaeon]
MRNLIVAEKPSVALRIALALGDGRPLRKNLSGIGYFEIFKDGDTLLVVAAAGHLFTLSQKGENRALPIFDLEWVPSFKVTKGAYFTKKYLDTIKEVSRNCDAFTNACDYDVEGTVIGTNIIKYVKTNDVNKEPDWSNVRRMHFSTTTRQDLLDAYQKRGGFDRGNFDAGETRHILDWMWGINFSRALMSAMYSTGNRKTMSIGRVQGPTLAVLAEREKEIKDFKPRDYWEVFITVNKTEFKNKRGAIFEEDAAGKLVKEATGAKARVDVVDIREAKLFPFPPFDLTSLQLEASRTLGLDPSRTLALAQTLYERSYISYPRTSSQKLPYSLNLPRIINALSSNPKYKEIADALIKASRFRPIEGRKEDEAHPAIYPTGEMPAKLTVEEEKLYDLITRRFLSAFAEPATIEHTDVQLLVAQEKYEAKGSRIVNYGWLSYYTYYKPEESHMPAFKLGAMLPVEKAQSKKLVTKPPDRYTKASLIALLEAKDLGTKATRAAIVDTLFNRGYITNKRIETTAYGMSVYEALKQHVPSIVDEALTRKLEEDMEDITRGKTTEQAVINEGKELIVQTIGLFKKSEKAIGEDLGKGLEKTNQSNVLGKCLKDGGNLLVRYSRAGKQFVGCANWPKCNQTYPLPQYAKIVPTGKVCPLCHTPIVKVFRKGKVFEMDLDPSCETKKNWGKKKEGKTEEPVAQKASDMRRVKTKRKTTSKSAKSVTSKFRTTKKEETNKD